MLLRRNCVNGTGIDVVGRFRSILVVLDIHMPRMNGLETVSAIEKLPQLKHTKVVVVSGEDRQQLDMTHCRLVDEWFAKPLNPAHLVGHLQSLAT